MICFTFLQMNSFDHMDTEGPQDLSMDNGYSGNHIDNYYGWPNQQDEYVTAGSPNSEYADYGETPSDMSSPMSQWPEFWF